MSGNLIDPNQPAGAIIVSNASGGAKRNDGVILKPANKNKWYVLATVFGEQKGDTPDIELHARNRRIWNGWMCQGMPTEERQALAEKMQLEPGELEDMTGDELIVLRKAFKRRLPGVDLPEVGEEIDLSKTRFPCAAVWDRCFFYEHVNFSYVMFSEGAYFELATFIQRTDFVSAGFNGPADFRSATFDGDADFSSATISKDATFASATFNRFATFSSMAIGGNVDFNTVMFNRIASFRSMVFSEYADFTSTRFNGDADFISTTFSGDANFEFTTFNGAANFEFTTFCGRADFSSTTFCKYADFSDGAFKAKTDFKETRFEGNAPEFFQREMHQGTSFTTKNEYWPDVTKENAEGGKQAYTRLRQLMSELYKPDDEHFFFRQEMRCKAELEKWPDNHVIKGFGLVSDFGNSVTRPVVGLLGAWLLPGLVYVCAYAGAIIDGTTKMSVLGPFGLSFANLFTFLGLNRLFYKSVINGFGPWLSFMAGAQTVAGVVLLFFFALGLRNRFRLR